MVFDKLRKTSDFTANMHRRRGVWNLNGLKDRTDPFVALVFPGDVGDDEGPGVKRLEILWRAEPFLA